MVSGYLVNLASGVFIVLAFEYYGTPSYTYTSEVLSIAPCFVSSGFMLDSLRRLKQVAVRDASDAFGIKSPASWSRTKVVYGILTLKALMTQSRYGQAL